VKVTRIAIVLAVVLMTALTVTATTSSKVRTFTGTYTCLVCDLQKSEGAHGQCDQFGHTYCLRLDNGRYIMFLHNDHAEDLVKGGGRTNFRMTVTGIYDMQSHTIDVQNYVIDGVKSTWCAEHKRMDNCAGHAAKNKLAASN